MENLQQKEPTLNERAEQLNAQKIFCFRYSKFYKPNAEERYRGPEPDDVYQPLNGFVPRGVVNPYIASLYRFPLLTKDGEKFLFEKYNYLKYRANRVRRERLQNDCINECDVGEVENLLTEASVVRQRIIEANLRLVVAEAKKKFYLDPDQFMQTVSNWNMILFRAAEKFDVARGNKFSTYATWAIIRSRSRASVDDQKRASRFMPMEDMDDFGAFNDDESPSVTEVQYQRMRRRVHRLLSCLTPREERIIRARFGLDREEQTLREIGEDIGITKERVRQIETRVLRELREISTRKGWVFDAFVE